MGTITKITTQKRKGRYNIFIDETYAFPVSEKTLIKFQLAKGQTLSPAEIESIKAGEVAAMADEIAFIYLSHRSRTEKEVAQRLRQEDIPETVIHSTLARLRDLNYLDDADFANRYVEENMRLGDKGPAVLRQKLVQKGIAPDMIMHAIEAITDQQWATLAATVAQKALRQQKNRAFHEQTERATMALRTKGFSIEQAKSALDQIAPQLDQEQEHTALLTELTKQWRLKRHFEPRTRRQKVKQALYRKGFRLEDIDAALDALPPEN